MVIQTVVGFVSRPSRSAMFVLVFCFAATASAEHTVFDYQVERFEGSGNQIGSYVDEFDDGVLAPWTQLIGGNAFEAEGILHLASPGVDSNSIHLHNPAVTLDLTDAIPPISVADGAGDFQVESRWTNLPELPGGFYGLVFRASDPLLQIAPQTIGLGLRNFSSSSVVFPYTGEPGLAIGIVDNIGDPATGQSTSIAEQLLPIDLSEVTGDVVLRLSFTDSTNEVVGSFSLDGGSTFQSPFTAVTSRLSPALFGDFLLVGDPITVVNLLPALSPMAWVVLALLLAGAVPVLRFLRLAR